jgi:mono/diheme cytochrome c family protein
VIGATRPRWPAGHTLILSALILIVVIDLCRGGEPPAANGATESAASAAVRAVYRQRCQRCHEADGTGSDGDAPDFTNAKWQKSRTDLQLLVSILDGKGSGMPGFRGKITDEQARELVAFTRAFAKGGAGAATDFASRFRQLQDELAALQQQFRALAQPVTQNAQVGP